MSESYRYDLEERSLTQHWLKVHAWEPLARLLPRWLSPNAITTSGVAAMILSLFFLKLALEGKRWGFVGIVVCTLLYFVADNIDGPHARRTGQSSQLGEFLDHWMDSINGAIMALTLALCLRVEGVLLLSCIAGVAIAYFATIWEQSRTGTFHSGRLGANEGILTSVGIYLLLAAFPDSTWMITRLGQIVPAFSMGVALVTVVKVLRRCRGHSRHFTDFAPILLSIAVLSALALADLLHPLVAVAGILAANVAFSGAVLIARLTGHRSRLRGPLASCISVLGLALLALSPQTLAPRVSFLAGTIAVLSILIVAWDLFRATRSLGPSLDL